MGIQRFRIMSEKPLPLLEGAIGKVLDYALHKAPDKWIRAELPRDWPVAQAITQMEAYRTTNLRLGVLRPFRRDDFAALTITICDDPQQLTDWRNESIEKRRASPSIIFGDARGTEESGLR